VGIERRRHVRVRGPFDGYRVGLIDTPICIADLSEGGCFISSSHPAPSPGQHVMLRIDLGEQGWICLKAKTVHARPDFGFAVAFIEVPADAASRLARALHRLRQSPDQAETVQSMQLPVCPSCQQTPIGPLRMAGSALPWFACQACSWIWPIREHEPDTSAPDADFAGPPTPSGSDKQILIADDDPGVLRFLCEVLSSYQVLPARNVAEAWAVGSKTQLDLVISDYLMPDGTGDKLIARFRQQRSSLKALILTGHGETLAALGVGCWTQERCLAKPCSVAELRAAVEELIGPA
jgi:CheY-like chemotaxis protein